MKIDGIEIDSVLDSTKKLLTEDESISPALRAAIELIMLVVSLLANRLGLNSQNSSKPPSTDFDRKKNSRNKSDNPAGGQKGREGKTLRPFEEPDVVKDIPVNRALLPPGKYRDAGVQCRQVVDIEISRMVTEYRAQILINETGKKFTAEFPQGVNSAIQYGDGIKAHAVYLSQYQLLPYKRIEEYFSDQLNIPISAGALFNFNQKASDLIEKTGAENQIKAALRASPVLHVDETGVNINGKRRWLHCASSLTWTYFHAHDKRGKEAMDAAEILPCFTGILCHDHWKPYYRYILCEHSLCNAHHLRELERAWEQDKQKWANEMRALLTKLCQDVKDNDGKLTPESAHVAREQYREILFEGDKECPPPNEEDRPAGQRGRLKRTKARAVLERLREFENDALRFIEIKDVPFTNNQGENDIRMTKVHQKISGCFRSQNGADMFCLLRSYISSCRKQDVSASEALRLLFKGRLPDIFSSA
jgi:transposase